MKSLPINQEKIDAVILLHDTTLALSSTNKNNMEELSESDWVSLSESNYVFSDLFFEMYQDKFSWSLVAKNKDLPQAVISKFCHKMDKSLVILHQTHIPQSLLDIFKDFDFDDWVDLFDNHKVSMDWVEKYADLVDWAAVSDAVEMDEAFMRKHLDKLDWTGVCNFQKLSEPFMREFVDLLNWIEVSYCQSLSVDFLRDFQDKILWSAEPVIKDLSPELKLEFKHLINKRLH